MYETLYPKEFQQVMQLGKMDYILNAELVPSHQQPLIQHLKSNIEVVFLPNPIELDVRFGIQPSQVQKIRMTGGFFSIKDSPLGPIIIDFRNITRYRADTGYLEVYFHQ